MPDPTFIPIWLRCTHCGHRWDDWQPVHVPIATWIAHSKTYHCPECGNGPRHLLIRTSLATADA